MRNNQTLSLLRANQIAVGTWLQLGSFQVARILAAQGCLDWLVVDLEHTPLDPTSAHQMYAAIADISQGRCTPMARLVSGSMEQIKLALDAGAQGIIVPMVNTARQAQDIVRFAYYPPEGERGAGGLTPHLGFGTNRSEYIRHANDQLLVGVQIESVEAVRNIAEIASVPGLDLIFIGPYDLHISLGLPGAFWSQAPVFVEAVRKVISTCQAKSLPLGILCGNAEQVKQRQADGFTFLGMGTDVLYLLDTYGKEYGELQGLAESPEGWANFIQGTYNSR
jgi:2-keto-3-deoxy-L-rhamnonate aldolase RhmA